MANMVQAVWLKAVALAMRLCSAVALLFSRAAGRALWRQRRGSTSADRLPTVRQQLPDAAVQLSGHTREDVFEVAPRVTIVVASLEPRTRGRR